MILARSVSKQPDRLLFRFRSPQLKHSSPETGFLDRFNLRTEIFRICCSTAHTVRTLLIAQSIVFLAECLWLFPKCPLLYPVSQLLLTMVLGASSGPDWGERQNRRSRCHTVFFRVLGPYKFITHDRSNGSIGVSNSVTKNNGFKAPSFQDGFL